MCLISHEYLHFLIDLLKHGWNDKLFLHRLDLLPRGPDVPQENLLSISVHR